MNIKAHILLASGKLIHFVVEEDPQVHKTHLVPKVGFKLQSCFVNLL